MNGRTQQQQRQQHDLLYSSLSPYWSAPTQAVLRSPCSAPSLKQSPHYGRNKRHSRNRSYSSSQDMDYNDVSHVPDRRQQPFSYGHTSSSGGHGYYLYYDQKQHSDYRNSTQDLNVQSSSQQPRAHALHYQRQQIHTVEQPYSRHRRTSLSSDTNRHAISTVNNYNLKNADRLVAIENSCFEHQNQHITPSKNHGQRKPGQQQIAPLVSTGADTNKKSNYRRQEPARLGHHHHYAAPGWKVSGQYNHPRPRSSLSPTPPSLYDNDSSSPLTTYTTLSTSSSAAPVSTENYQHQHRFANGTTYHRKRFSVDPHQKKQSILASSATSSSTTTASSSSLGSASYYYQTTPVKPPSTNYRHSYSDYHDDYQNPCQSTQAARTRRYSQGDSKISRQTTSISSTNQSTRHGPVPRRVSTPKLRRVCSAKPYMEQPPRGDNGNNDNDDDVLAATMDAASLSLAKNILVPSGANHGGACDDSDSGNLVIKEQQASPNFWNPRSEKDIIPVKRTLSRRIRGLLLPQRNKLGASVSKEQQLATDYQWNLTRPLTPVNELSFDNDALLEDQENGVMRNPFYMISQSWDIADRIGLFFDKADLIPVDAYISSIQQMDSCLTPETLSQQYLARPYRRELHRLRALFTWIIQNITIIEQGKLNTAGGQYRNGDGDGTATATANAGVGFTTTITNTIQPSKVSLRQRLTTRRSIATSDQEEEFELPAVDVMHGDGLLPEGGGNVDSFDDWLFSESAQQVLLHRKCSSSIGMANLFCEMATAAGFSDARIVYGYLRAPKDSINTACMDNNGNNEDTDVDDSDNFTLIQNHAWCCVKVEGECRFVDCWLASPFQPQNMNKMESHWFLTKPTDLIYTHFPQEVENQCLEPAIHVTTFFALPYVWAPFFTQHIKMIRYNPNAITLMEDQVCHLVFRVDSGATCIAFVETDPTTSLGESTTTTTTMRCLAQSRMVPHKNGSLERIYKVKAVLPPGHDGGWLKIYAGHSPSPNLVSDGSTLPSARHDHNTNGSTTSSATLELPPLALCFRLTVDHDQYSSDRRRQFEFVHLHPCRHEFYIREPQCYQLYPLYTYNFFVRGDDTHHKLAIKSPGGKLYKLMYYPQEHTYDGSVKIAEIGKWSLVSLLNHSGDLSVVATWECRS